MKRFLLVLTLVGIVSSCTDDKEETAQTAPYNPSITFHLDSVTTLVLNRSSLKSDLVSSTIDIYDFVHEKHKNYRAFALEDVLIRGFGQTAYTQAGVNQQKFKFSALDGFSDTATAAQVLAQGGFVAFEDLDVSGEDNWELVATENNNNPAPYYIVWSDSTSQNPRANNFPWPYQLAEISIVD